VLFASEAFVQRASFREVADVARVFVVGTVNQPGDFRYERGITAERAIESAGGLRHPFMTNPLTVIRLQKGQKVRLAASGGTVLESGDTLDVMEVNDGENRCK